MSKLYLGIDNGKQGALVAVDEHNDVVHSHVMPMLPGSGPKQYNWPQVALWLRQWAPQHVSLEKVFVTPVIGKRAIQSLADCLGVLKGLCLAMGLSHAVYSPKDWQRWAFRGVTYSDTKAASITVAQRLQPNHQWTVGRSKKPHDGLTDAYHMALYGKQTLYGTT